MLVEESELGDRCCEIRAEGLGLGAMGSELWAVGSGLWDRSCGQCGVRAV